MSEEKKWLIRAKETYKFHRAKLLSDSNWNTILTAKALRRSHGGICEDLMIARWLKSHEKILEKFDYAYEALNWIRKKEKEQDLGELE